MTAGTKATHTPGPWRRGQTGNLRLYGPDGMGRHSGVIATFYRADDLERTVHCVNAYDDMLAALRSAEDWLKGFASAEPYLSVIQEAIAKAETAYERRLAGVHSFTEGAA